VIIENTQPKKPNNMGKSQQKKYSQFSGGQVTNPNIFSVRCPYNIQHKAVHSLRTTINRGASVRSPH